MRSCTTSWPAVCSEMAGDIIMCHLIMQDATNRPDLFKKSANIYVRFTESEIEKHNNYPEIRCLYAGRLSSG